MAIYFVAPQFETIGCYQDRASRAIPTLENKEPILDGNYWTRQNPIEKCYEAAKKRGFNLVSRLLRLSTNMADRLPVSKMVKVGLGLIKFITSKVSKHLHFFNN